MLMLPFAFQSEAQSMNCTFKEPVVTLNFGAGDIGDLNDEMLFNYRRVARDCPTDGHYSYTSFTSDCFRSDWITLPEDHTPGDVNGNMMIVNASPFAGTFLTTRIQGLKGGTTYEFSVWMLNVCKPTDKCPFPLLPNISIVLHRPDGKIVSEFSTGELIRRMEPQWTRYQVMFTTTPSENNLTLTMIDNAPGGCGNDFALDDISIRECIPVVINKPKAPVVAKKQPPAPKPVPKKEEPVVAKKTPVIKTPPPIPEPVPKKETPPPVKKQPELTKTVKPPAPKVVEKPKPKPPQISQTPQPQQPQIAQVPEPKADKPPDTLKVVKPKPQVLPPPPPLVSTRANPLIKLIDTEAGEIKLDLYDNGEIDGDTISVYHNNTLLVGHARLSAKPITFHITVDPAHPHHELVMVAHNLGSIPPNTSLMVITAGSKRYEVFISSTEQKNGKVIIDLKE